MSKKVYRVGVTTRHYRAGLGPAIGRVTVGAHDSSPEALAALDRILMASNPPARLTAIQKRAKAHRGVMGLAAEIAWIETRMIERNGNGEAIDTFALLSIERALDLLDTGQYLAELTALRRAHAGQTDGIIESAKSRAKLPDAETLARQIDELTKTEGGNRRRAVGIVAERTGASTQALGQKLKKRRETT